MLATEPVSLSLRNRWKIGSNRVLLGMESDMRAPPAMREPKFAFGPDLVKLIAEIDEFKGRWEALKTLSPDRLNALRKVATIESVGSSTRIEGAKLSDAEVEDLLSRAVSTKSFKTRDEQEVAGYCTLSLSSLSSS